MPRPLLRGAGVGATLALVLILTRLVSPTWGPLIVPVVGGLVLAALFVRTYVREAPSVDRFRRLSLYGMGAVAGPILGTVYGITQLPLGLDYLQRGWIIVVTFLAI